MADPSEPLHRLIELFAENPDNENIKNVLDTLIAHEKIKLDHEEMKLEHARSREQETESYRRMSLWCGLMLGAAGLGLAAFGMHKGADLTPLIGLFGPIAGIAGVFIWGYRPNASGGAR